MNNSLLHNNKPPSQTISLKELLTYLLLFNGLFLTYLILQIINHPDNTYYWVIGVMKQEQFLFSYQFEFMKRGLVGTFFSLFDFIPTPKQIYFASLITSNTFFILYLMYAQKMMLQISPKQFHLFIILFILSPAVALHLGYDPGRFDQITLVITLAILLIVTNKKKSYFALIPLLVIVGLLIHEAFLFINVPVILAIVLNETKKHNCNSWLLVSTIMSIVAVLTLLFFYGKINEETFQFLVDKAGYTDEWHGKLFILTRSITENIHVTLASYGIWRSWICIIVTFSISFIYLKPYIDTFNKYTLDIFKALTLLSPFSIFIMFILGIDFDRWFALLIINLFIVYPYLIKEFKIIDLYANLNKTDKLFAKTGFVLFIIGPIGVVTCLPYIDVAIKRIL